MSDQKTRVIQRNQKEPSSDEKPPATPDPTQRVDSHVEVPRDEPAEPKSSGGPEAADARAASSSSDATRVFAPSSRWRKERAARQEAQSAAAEPGAAVENPVVGWLVLVDGPGKGRALELGYGMNDIGRGEDARIPLPFGDEEISRHQHAIVTYDPRGRLFYIQHGNARNLTYLNGQPVLQPNQLQGGERITMGVTELMFVPLCGPDFDWQDGEEGTE